MVQDGEMADDSDPRHDGARLYDPVDGQASPAEPTDEEFATPIVRRSVGASSPLLAGMMLAVGEIIEPEKTHVEIAIEHARPVDDPIAELDFGSLPPLD